MSNPNFPLKILVIHGPNMNLIGLRYKKPNPRFTLDKINKQLRREAKLRGYEVKIFQTNSESTAVTLLQRQRNKICGLLLFPGAWQKSGYIMKDTLDLLSIPFITISLGENADLLKGIENIKGPDLKGACQKGLSCLIDSISH